MNQRRFMLGFKNSLRNVRRLCLKCQIHNKRLGMNIFEGSLYFMSKRIAVLTATIWYGVFATWSMILMLVMKSLAQSEFSEG